MRKLTTTIQRPCWNMLKLPELSWSSFTPGLHNDGDRRWTCRCLLELTSRRPQLIDSLRSFHLIGHRLRMFADKLCTTRCTQSRPFSLLPKATNTPGDSWRNFFLEDFIKFLCETSPWYAYCNPLPNIAAPEGNECGQRPLPACMASRESICMKADRQQSHILKDNPISPPKRRRERVRSPFVHCHSSMTFFCEQPLIVAILPPTPAHHWRSMSAHAPCLAHAVMFNPASVRFPTCRTHRAVRAADIGWARSSRGHACAVQLALTWGLWRRHCA